MLKRIVLWKAVQCDLFQKVLIIILFPLINANLVLSEGAKQSSQDLEDFKVQIQRFDGATIRVPTDFTYVDITIPEGNFNLIR